MADGGRISLSQGWVLELFIQRQAFSPEIIHTHQHVVFMYFCRYMYNNNSERKSEFEKERGTWENLQERNFSGNGGKKGKGEKM